MSSSNPSDEADVATCELCDEERANVEAAELGPWPAGTVDACPVCRYFYDTGDRDDCLTCGDEDAGNYVELEARIGEVDVHGCISGKLCDECAEHFAAEVTQARRNIPVDVLVAASPNHDIDDYPEVADR